MSQTSGSETIKQNIMIIVIFGLIAIMNLSSYG